MVTIKADPVDLSEPLPPGWDEAAEEHAAELQKAFDKYLEERILENYNAKESQE